MEHEGGNYTNVIGAFGTVTKGLLKGLKDLEIAGRVETTQTKHYWERPEYWEESWRFEETCCNLNSIEKQSAEIFVKNYQGVIIIIIICTLFSGILRYKGIT